ncbi:hypothetical protein ACYZUD_20525 [Pseudomonas sp. XS1P51]
MAERQRASENDGLCLGLDATNLAEAFDAGNAVVTQIAQWIAEKLIKAGLKTKTVETIVSAVSIFPCTTSKKSQRHLSSRSARAFRARHQSDRFREQARLCVEA